MLVPLIGDQVGHLCERLIVAGQGYSQVGFLDLALLLRAQLRQGAVDLVHGRVLWVVFWVQKALDSAILCELLPIIHVLEDVIHGDSNLPS